MRETPHPTRATNETAAPVCAGEGVVAGTGGAVYVEFLLAFIPVFVMILGIAQIALMYVGHLVVQHAAVVATRAAIVVLPDDPRRYGGAPVNDLATGADPCTPGAVEALVSRIAAAASVPALPGCGGGGGGGSGGPAAVYAARNLRLRAIHDAASIPLMAVSPSLQQLAPATFNRRRTIREALGTDAASYRAATGGLLYNRAAMSVTFPTLPGAATFRNRWSATDDSVTVRVTYLFHCAVPIVRMFMCAPRGGVRDPGAAELGAAPWASLLAGTAFATQRFAVIRAEATMPLQRAGYAY